MFLSFKNIELSRYSVSSNLSKIEKKIIKQNSSNVSLLAGSIFSGSFSVLATYISIKYTDTFTWKLVLLSTIIFSASFIASFYVYKFARFLLKYLYNKLKKEHLSSTPFEIKEIIDDFDHIACDNILAAYEFQKSFIGETNPNVANYYYHEMIYYLKVAIDKTTKVLKNSKSCINTLSTVSKIDLFRIENILDMMDELYKYISKDEIKAKIKIDSKLKSSFEHKISNIKDSINDIRKDLNDFKENNF
jgi:hypothetical protein